MLKNNYVIIGFPPHILYYIFSFIKFKMPGTGRGGCASFLRCLAPWIDYFINVLPTAVVQFVIGPGYIPITRMTITEAIITIFKEAGILIFVVSSAQAFYTNGLIESEEIVKEQIAEFSICSVYLIKVNTT